MKKLLLYLGVILTMFVAASCYKTNYETYIYEIHTESSTTVNITFSASVNMDTIVQDTVVVQSKVSLLGLSELAQTSATVEGVVEGSSNQADFAYGICWGTSPNPTIENYHCDPIRFEQSQHFQLTIGNLTANTKYYVRPFMFKSNEYIYGAKSDSFTTKN